MRRKLGLEYPVPQLLGAHSNSKESTYMTLHRDVSERSKNIQDLNTALKAKLKQARLEQETSTKGLQAFKLRCEEQLAALEKGY